jgi:hypothetical protein
MHTVLSRHQNGGQNHNLPIANKSLKNVVAIEIKSRLNLGNACYCSLQTLLLSRLLSKNIQIKIYKTIIIPVVLYGCET